MNWGMKHLRFANMLLASVALKHTANANLKNDSDKTKSKQALPNRYQFYQFGPMDCKFELVANTWPWLEANNAAWNELTNINSNTTSIDAIVAGCSKAEELQYDHTVGYGGSPDTMGESTLDAMIMHGPTHDVGSVGNLRRIKDAIKLAKYVLYYTKHTLLVGESATQFALQMGFNETNLTSDYSLKKYQKWIENNCQPNFYNNCIDYNKKCPPYAHTTILTSNINIDRNIDDTNTNGHDTIGMIAIESNGSMTIGTSTNGATHKIAGRVGDGPIVGSGGYVEQGIGCAVATGDGDIMMRFLPTKEVVMYLELGYNPTQACLLALQKIAKFYPNFQGSIVCVSQNGQIGAASYGWTEKYFQFVVRDSTMNNSVIYTTDIEAPIVN